MIGSLPINRLPMLKMNRLTPYDNKHRPITTLKRPWPQYQPDAGGRQDPNGNCDDFFHQAAPSVAGDDFGRLLGSTARTDW